MKHLFQFLFVLLLFSCSKEKEPIQGKLEDFISGEMSFERDAETGFLGFLGTVDYQSKEAAYTESIGAFNYYNPTTGRKIGSFEIPAEGPMSLKGRVHISKSFDENTVVAANTLGYTNVYKDDTLYSSFQLDMSDLESNTFFSFPLSGNALYQVAPGQYEITFNPFDFMAQRMGKNGFDLTFSSWIVKFDEEGNWLCKTDFKAPYDESYANSSQASSMVRMVENGNSWGMFAYSDSLYQIKDCKVVKRIKLPAVSPMTYFPDKYEGDKNKGSWERPEDGAINYRLVHDQPSGMFVRLTQIKERRPDPDFKDPHKRMYSDEKTFLLLIYDSEWNLRAELEVTYPSGTRFENLFSTSEGLFINKPEQASEDEYEFYKIDLSQFAD
ncbi:hypothetical protein PBT90_02235 [Algoriphagus halophytocola]|uniref:DUF4221 domain-containing protein n=1 Tax=Algoriphagus halophytocola TaxID=2991499 RepID=A0ABY6MFQ4_9BACT|nr:MULTISPECIES: hypothetical protein [unclassified Algoriphagus]UZD22264.1 hypothetical protein OM944_16580 [Algoriphagus sp. TR-M5]WBL43512.1 hypothetical protein PBT90_02235 [Algoriphagus sp. TR-M9]